MKLRTRLFIFSSLFLVLLPWFGWHFYGKVEQSLLQGQGESQSMVAAAIAMVLKGSTVLFQADKNALYVYPVRQNIDVDGYVDDWDEQKLRSSSFVNDFFSVLLVANEKYLYAHIQVTDSDIIYRNPRYVPLDSSDHIRLEYIDEKNNHRRFVLLAEGQGRMSVYEVKQDWQRWVTGHNVSAIHAVWRETKAGYDVEIRLPRTWLQPNQRLAFGVVSVFGENERNPDTIVSTYDNDNGILNPLLFRSSEINNIIKNLSETDLRICVVDKYRRVRQVSGGKKLQSSFCQSMDKISATLVNKVLAGEPQLTTVDEKEDVLIVAAQPVFSGSEIIGAVLVGNNKGQILKSQRETLVNIVLVMLGIFFMTVLSLLFFGSWLAFRINRLKNQAVSLIDESGRFINHIKLPDNTSSDELGELSRSFSALLDKLNRYTCFLETVPRMLRHEILNPVNTISMSLQNLQKQNVQPANKSSDAEIANDAVQQLQLIVSCLTEAANIDDALKQDEIEPVDISALLSEYVHNSQNKHRNVILRYSGVDSGVFIAGSGIRLVQLFDKIKDNALDFAVAGTEICFQLEPGAENEVVISIINEGETIPKQQLDIMFQGMSSHRSVKTETPHLGIGLYVSYQIARFHQGCLQIANRKDKQGVVVSLTLPTITNY